MHSIFSTMPSKNAVTMPLGTGAFFISIKKQFNSLIYSLNPFIMKKKVFSLMMMLLLAFMGVAKADVVTIGDGTSTTYVTPFNSLWGYSFVEQIYTADEIGTAGTINAISFNLQSTSTQTNQVDVFMKAVSRNTFSGSTDFESVTASDMVFSGTVTFNTGWTTITLDTPFQYDGTSNLMIGMHEYTSGYSTRYFYYTSATDKVLSYHSDSANPDPYDLGSYSGNKYVSPNRANIQIDITAGGGSGAGDQLYALQNGEVVETVVVGTRPNGCWMEPFRFSLRNDGPAITVTHLDFTPQEYFTVVEPEMPFAMAHNEEVGVALSTGSSTNTTWQMVAIYGTGRTARVWDIVAEPYDPAVPDVWELACEEATTFPFVEWPASAHNTTLHNDYTLPFPEIPEGNDAVYKLVFAQDQMLNAEVTSGADGKVAIYTEDFYGEGGPMATNNYTGPQIGGGPAAAGFEAQIGDGTNTLTYFPFHTLWNYSLAENLFLASELTEAGVTTAPMTSLSWFVSSTSCTTPQNGISIWMGNVSDAALTSTSHTTAGMTLVYTGSDILPVEGWNEFVFNEGNFAWDGQSNVLILCQRQNGSWQGSVSWQTHNPGFAATCYAYTDTAPGYDATSQTYSMTTSTTNRANIIMKSDRSRVADRAIVTYDFENQQVPAGWDNTSSYPWTVVEGNGGYVLKSGNGGVASSTSTISATFELATDGTISFDAECMGEGTGTAWDKCIFTLDGAQQFSYGAHVSGWNNYSYEVAAGSHTCTWTYSKDSSVNPTGDYFMIDNVTIATAGGDPTPGPIAYDYSFGPVITNMPVEAGTYYLVASSTDANFQVTINAENMPCPQVEGFAFNPTPADDEDGIEPGSVTLRWNIPSYATGWRLIFGTTYYPDPNHPQTVMYPEDGSFSTTLANSYTVRNLWNNTNYFWRVEFNNAGACPEGVSSPVWGFTTHLNIPQNLTAVDYTVFDDETIVLNWNAVVDRTFRTYNVYRDGALIGSTQVNNIGNATYTDGPLAYNMAGYTYYITAVYDEGESAPSDPVTVKVSGYGNVNGHVYEQDGTTGIAGATVTMVGVDEFNVNHTYNFTTNAQGYYSGHIYAGYYDGQAAKEGYQTIEAPVQGNPIVMVYNQTTSPVDYILDENFDPVCGVIAEYYPDSLDPQSPYVKVYWGCGLPGSEIIEPFETGDFSLFDWQVDPTYPWTITTTNPYEGTYCMKSGGAGVANVVSNMSVTVNIPADGLMSFFGKISCESSWDYGYFYIDGVQKGSYTGASAWSEKVFDITAGDHTFMWQYTKDGSVNSNDDCFYVDYITFYKQPAPPVPGMTYDFEDHTMQGWTSVDADGDGYGWRIGSEVMTGVNGHNSSADFVFSQSYDNSYGVLYPDNYLVSPQVQLGGIVRFYACAQDANYAAEHFGVAVSTTNTNPSSFTTVQEWTMSAKSVGEGGKPVRNSRSGRDQGNWYEYTVDLSAYSGNGYVAIRHFNCSDMFYLDVDDITIGEPGKGIAETRSLNHYRVYRTSCYNDGPYTEDNTVLLATVWVPDTVYIDVEWADLAPGMYKWGVGSVYSGNRGEEIEGAINWAEPMQVGGTRETLTCDFEGGMPAGWTVIDGNNDGLTWTMTSDIPTTWTYYASLTLDWYHGGTNAICSGSYINGYGAVTPDEYLVSPQVTLGAGSTIDFWVAATDASYPADHFGVFVSDNGTSNWTSVQEWTLTAKKAGLIGGAASRNGEGLRLGNWYNYTVDLSAYAGQKYIAFRHFNCYDQYIMCLDDITINTSGGPVPPTPPTPPTPGQGGTQLVNFEGGEIPAGFDNNASNYPWIIWNDNPYSGSYCMASGNYNVASSESYIDATVEFVTDGSIDFYSRISSESVTYDYGVFYIDGVEQYREGGTTSWTNRHFSVSAGSHTFRWYYRKDSSVNSGEDRYFIDEITFEGVPGGGGNGNNLNWLALPRESETIWSNCLDKDMYIAPADVTVLLNSADSPEGTVVTFTNYNEAEQLAYPIAPITLDETGFYAFDSFRRGAYRVTVEMEGYEPIVDSINFIDYPNNLVNEMHLRYVMTEILYGVGDVYVSRTGWAMWDGESIAPTPGPGGNASTFDVDFEAGMPEGWNVIDGNNDGWTWCLTSNIPSTWTYYASLTLDWYHSGTNAICSGSYINGVGALNPDEYLVSPQVTLAAGSQLSFWVAATDASYPADHFGVFVSDNGTSDWTSVQEWTLAGKKSGMMGGAASRDGEGLRLGNWYNYTVDLSAYAGQKYIAFRHFNCYDQYIMCLDDITLTSGAKDGDRHLEYYKVMCTSIDGVPIFNHNTVHPFCQLSTDEPYNAPLVEGEHYLCKVACVYSTGMSAWSTPVEWEYEPCDHWGPVDEVTVNTQSQGNHIEWVFEHGYNPYDPGTGPVPPTPGQGDWYYYDDGVNVDAIGLTAGGSFYWGVMFPAGSYQGNMVTKVSMYDYDVHTGNILVYQGGSTAPGTLVGQQAYSCTGSQDFVEWTLDNPAVIDPTQNLWIVMNNNNGQFVASACNNTGNANGRWISIDGATWEDVASYGLDYTWMLRAYVASGAKGEPKAISYNGKSSNGGTFAISGNGPRVRTVTENVSFAMLNESTLEFNIADIANYDARVYFLYNLVNDSRFTVVNGEENGTFIVSTDDNISMKESFADFIEMTMSNFGRMNKYQAADAAREYKNVLPMTFVNSLMMDIYAKSRDNSHCADAYPFCTDEGMYEFPAGVNAGSGETGPDYDCLYTTPNPAWYYMKMSDPGDMDIYMYSTPSVDIDFCCWGPFDDPISPCPNGLTSDKVVSCSYSAQPTEHCMIPASAQTGEYYILVITNYSNQACNINFSKVGGSGSTDCSIIPPTNVDIIGFLITQDGEYLAFAGPDDREYDDLGEYGDHVYCVRPIYPGEMTLPDHNYGWSMGCPVCQGDTGECAPGAPIYAEDLGETDQIKVWWGDENPGPGPGGCEGDEFSVNFESGLPAGWTTIDADGDGDTWMLASTGMGTGYGHNGSSDMIFSRSYDNNFGPLTPDNWLVTPAVTLCEGSTFSFWACAQDASYAAEHFGLAVSENGTDFTMVQEWTMTAKGEGKAGGASRSGRAQGNWYQYTVNLGDYAGEGRKIALRHFNCTDWFYLDVDDIELTVGAKNRDAIVKYNVYRSDDNETYTMIGEVAAVAGQTYYEYIDTPETVGTYYYQVRADYGDCESDPAVSGADPTVNYVTGHMTGMDELDANVNLYPNPTKGNVTIEANGMSRITVVSVLGQVVFDTELDANEYTLNMARFNAGMYMVRIYTENGMTVKRVTVMQ